MMYWPFMRTNKSKSKAEIVKLMKDKIDSLLSKDKKLSNHCITIDAFKKMNTFDRSQFNQSQVKEFKQREANQCFSGSEKAGLY